MNKSDNINELAKALAVAQSEMDKAAKNSKNPFYKSSYANHSSVWEACCDALTKNGLSVCQVGDVINGEHYLTTVLLHTSGQWISGELPIKPLKQDPQSIGSAITYMRRYGLQAIVSVATEDDDGEAAMGRKPMQYVEKEIDNSEALKQSKDRNWQWLLAVAVETGYTQEDAGKMASEQFGVKSKYELTFPQIQELSTYMRDFPKGGKNEKTKTTKNENQKTLQ